MPAPVLRTFQRLCHGSRTLAASINATTYTCRSSTQTVRTFSSTSTTASGHSRWSKIKHDKAKVDARRGAGYSKLSQEISFAVRDGGSDTSNLRLKAAVEAAKKACMPKDRITTAIERGQGKSATGVALEPVFIEAIGPGKVALVIDCLTDNKLRTLQDVKVLLGKYSAQTTPTAYLFSRKGLVRVLAGSGGHAFDTVLEIALEVEGTEDVKEVAEGEDGKPEVVITTEPAQVRVVATGVKEKLPGLEIINYGIEWVPNEDTMVEVGREKWATPLEELLEKLDDVPEVNDVYTNAKP